MQHLSREKCEELEAARFSRIIRCGDWFYRVMLSGERARPELWCGDDWQNTQGKAIKCPSTDELKRELLPLGAGDYELLANLEQHILAGDEVPKEGEK